jgi:hypothetical protein
MLSGSGMRILASPPGQRHGATKDSGALRETQRSTYPLCMKDNRKWKTTVVAP